MSAPADPVYRLSDLATWPQPGTWLAVLGHPIRHSLSPLMHHAALRELAATEPRFRDWHYLRLEVPPADLPAALALLHEKKFHGLNLTVPHKIMACDLVAAVDPAARPIAAVNTLLSTPSGWLGHNTDGYGLAAAVREDLDLTLTGTPIILLGAGGAARGAAVECLQRGCASLAILNRSRANLDALLAHLAPLAGEIPLRGISSGDSLAALPPHALVINATSAGLQVDDPLPVELSALPVPAAVFDMIYNPPQTPLLRAAAARGLPTANGLGMLVHQGAKALEIWSGIPAARTAPAMAAALRAHRHGV
ncbi:shikimate dehydrogenase [Horticoccus luteus]|uniref:Shikimate dehydrogenase (NADP(+)) n=1 Tax=Horticoccus luteus TaxID=2862869 RepID=A0A8F9TWP9_9BACT|nr:shikimate dehydrogenase [Horticoccus luteus]QYM79386.1 shikimate dehydrogenase [Horticoccus luteus]